MAKATPKPTDKTAVNPQTGLTGQDLEALALTTAVAEAEKKVEQDAPKKEKRKWILQEIKVDKHNTIRRRVLLTPSMCRKRGCNFDAAKEIGFKSGWLSAPLTQALPDGRTVEEAILGVLNRHVETAHVLEDSHIWDDDQLAAAKGLGSLPDAFLTGARV